MSDPNDNPPGYATAFQQYFDKGWRGILPLRHGSKWPPPRDHTGYGNPDPSYPDLMAWADSDAFRQGNLGLRLPDGVVGIDVDEYGAKNGAATFAEAIRRWGPLPDAPRTTSRPDNRISGIRLFAVPLGTMLVTKIEFPDTVVGGQHVALHLGDVEVIQPHHRYAMSWPSIHPEGGLYEWRNDAGDVLAIPNLGDVPTFPSTWLEGLRVVHESNLEYAASDVTPALTDGQPSPIVLKRLSQAFSELNMPGCSRHDTCTRHVMALMRYGKSGEPGVWPALMQLCEVLVAIRAADGSGDRPKTLAEFKRMIFGDNIARELSKPGITDWLSSMIVEGDFDEKPFHADVTPEPQPVVPPAEDTTGTGLSTQSDNEGRSTQPTRQKTPLEAIERGFWQSRDSLAAVYQTSMAKMCPPWSVLAICAARALTMVRPHVTLPPLIGGPGSLNWFGAIVAGPAGGKTTSGSAAGLLVPGHLMTCYQGTGEGILASFGQAGDPADPKSTPEHEAVFLDVDEVDGLGAVSQRSGSTTMPILRSAFSGATIAFSYSNKDKRRFVRKHTYRMAGIVGMQPKRAGWVLADADGGTPQRFMWFPASDPRVRRERPWESGPLTLPNPGEWLYPRELSIPMVAENLILDEHVKRQQGDGEALDGHALFCREKFAYALTILDGRLQMNEEDWELSGIAADVSFYTRATVVQELKDAARIEALDRGEIKGIEMHAADDAKEYESAEKIRRLLRWVLDKLVDAGENGLTHTELTRKCAGRDRRWLAGALQIGTSNGLIRQDPNTTIWTKI